jgi:hypothetical protein
VENGALEKDRTPANVRPVAEIGRTRKQSEDCVGEDSCSVWCVDDEPIKG